MRPATENDSYPTGTRANLAASTNIVAMPRITFAVLVLTVASCGASPAEDPCAVDNGGCGSADQVACGVGDDDGVTCTDIDDCAVDNGGCGDPAFNTCVNNDLAPRTCVDLCGDWVLPTAETGFGIDAPAQATLGESLTFSVTATDLVNVDDYDFSWFVDAAPNQEPLLVGSVVSHAYEQPSRYRVVLTATHRDNADDVTRVLHYIDVARAYEATVYAVRDTMFAPQAVLTRGEPGGTGWCSGAYNVYYGKYVEFWDELGIDTDRSHIVQSLALGDTIFETYGNLLGWDYRANPGPRVTTCQDVGGAVSGADGMFLSGFHTPQGEPIKPGLLLAMAHEFMHMWDFRGPAHVQGHDEAHVMTSAMERHVLAQLDIARLRDGESNDVVVPPRLYERSRSHYSLRRYLARADLGWDSYFSEEKLSTPGPVLWETEDLPERQERLYVQGGFLSAVRDMHGPAALRAYFMRIDRLLAEHPEWSNGTRVDELPADTRIANMFMTLADSLRLDVAPYFDYWKIPITQDLRSYSGRYPRSHSLDDLDGDGVSRLHGDADDCDSSVYPGAPELDDGVDNNQEGQVDENVYDESILGDFDVQQIELPALIIGDITSQKDFDELRVTIPAGMRVAVIIHAGDAHESIDYAPGDTRKVSVYTGTVAVGGRNIPSYRDWHSDEGYVAVVTGDGTEMTIRLDALDRPNANGNPGRYELQLVAQGHQGAAWDTESLLAKLY